MHISGLTFHQIQYALEKELQEEAVTILQSIPTTDYKYNEVNILRNILKGSGKFQKMDKILRSLDSLETDLTSLDI